MKKILLTLTLAQLIFTAQAQCPIIVSIMVDACPGSGIESDNEFIFFLNGNTPLPVDNIGIVLPNNAPITTASATDFSPNIGTKTPTAAGCSLVTLDDGAIIPANAPVIIFTSNRLEFAYNLSNMCGIYGTTIYLLFKNQTPAVGTFANTAAAVRNTDLSFVTTYTGCNATYRYTNTVATTDGVYYRFPTPVAGLSATSSPSNDGCNPGNFNILPITFKSFSAKNNSNSISLNWQAVSTDNTSYFSIEKSINGSNYISLTRVNAITGENNYTFSDNGTNAGNVFYRIKMTDADGSTKFSNIIRIQAAGKTFSLNSIYPAVASSAVNLQISSDKKAIAFLEITDVTGRLLKKQTLALSDGIVTYPVDVSSLSAGSYFVRIAAGEETLTGRFSKQ
jgi:Secretion system C-terminal sorting domain